jgi:endonuclease YncB( thermonuclease family)
MASTKHITNIKWAPIGGVVLLILVYVTTADAASETCKFTSSSVARVARISDGRTLILEDGRELRLAGVETNDESKAVLRSLAEGQTLQLEYDGTSSDRYGRISGFAFPDGVQQSLQALLVQQGMARVSARAGKCAKELLNIEQTARKARRGLWADPKFAPLHATNLARIRMAHGHFALVEGEVLSVRESGAIIYLNFGRHWIRDFSVSIPRQLAKKMAQTGVDLTRLEKQRIRVRGWVEQRGGPTIEVDTPEQIEILN